VLRTKNRRSRSLSWRRAPHERRSKKAVGRNCTPGTKVKSGGLMACSARKKIKRSQAHERRSKKPSGRNRTPGTKVKSGGLMVCSARKTKEVVGLVACSTQKMGEEGGVGIRQKSNELQAGIEGVLRTKKIRRSRWVGGAPE
jgi:hypothetical protein